MGRRSCISRVSEKNRSDGSLTAACRFKESPSGTEMRRVFLCYRSALSADPHEAYAPRAKTKPRLTRRHRSLCLYPSFRLRSASSLSSSLDAVNGGRGGWAGGQQHHSRSGLHQHPQADHVRAHVPENADASHGPGWALRWRTGPACGLSGMRQTRGTIWAIVGRGERDAGA